MDVVVSEIDYGIIDAILSKPGMLLLLVAAALTLLMVASMFFVWGRVVTDEIDDRMQLYSLDEISNHKISNAEAAVPEASIIALAVGLTFFSAAFSVGDTLFEVTPLGRSFPSKELPEGGTWGLRITSFIVAYKVAQYAVRAIQLEKVKYNQQPGSTPSESRLIGLLSNHVSRLKERLSSYARRLNERLLEVSEGDLRKESEKLAHLEQVRGKEEQNMIALAQYGIYVTVIATLWCSTVFGVHEQWPTIIFTILGGAFFFVIDDWAIINEYSDALKGHMMRAHTYRVHGFNLFIYVMMLSLIVTWLFSQENNFASIVLVVVAGMVLLFLNCRYERLPVRLGSLLHGLFKEGVWIGYAVVVLAFLIDLFT